MKIFVDRHPCIYSHGYNSGLIDVKELQGTFCKENNGKVDLHLCRNWITLGITQSSARHLHWDT